MNSQISFIDLTREELDIMEQLALKLKKINPLKEPETFCEKANELSKQIPIRIKSILQNF